MLILQSSAILTLGFRMVKTEWLCPPRSLSGPSSISTFSFDGSTRADFDREDIPNNRILSTVQSLEYLLPPTVADALLDESIPLENLKRR